MRVFRRQLLPVGVVFGAFALVSCGAPVGTEDWFNQEISYLQDKTIPPNCTVRSSTGPMKESMTLEARWECESMWDSGQYRQWVAKQIAGVYKTIHSDPDRFIFGKELGAGDFESVVIESKPAGEKLHIRVTFQTYPD